jgi:hypothetical protein
VAHEDIHPTQEWQDEIENALSSMDAFVAVLTPDFHESFFTDQEVGFALARGVPMIALKLGRDPYGFIGKFQALTCSWEEAPAKLAGLLTNQPRMLDAYISALPNCGSFEQANKIAGVLPLIEKISDEQVHSMISAFNENVDLNGSFGFNGTFEYKHGKGLAFHLSRLTGRTYGFDSASKCVVLENAKEGT